MNLLFNFNEARYFGIKVILFSAISKIFKLCNFKSSGNFSIKFFVKYNSVTEVGMFSGNFSSLFIDKLRIWSDEDFKENDEI